MERSNILLVMLDATRASACSCYGCKHLTTPVLDKLATEGVLFEQAISAAPWTLPAIASLFTGLFPSQTGVYGSRRLPSGYPTLAELLSQNGYTTFGITNNSWLSASFGLQYGFKAMHKQWQRFQTEQEINKLVLMEKSQKASWARAVMSELTRGNLFKNAMNAAFTRFLSSRRDLGASRIMKPVAQWVDSQKGPWFAFVHYLEAHLPYKPPLKWAARFVDDLDMAKKWIQADQIRAAWRHIAGVEKLSEEDLSIWRNLYLAEVAYADYHLGALIDWLERTDRLDNTLVIVVADHGENLGEHGLLNHQYCVYDTLIRVPLIVRLPSLLPSGQRVTRQVQTLDLFRTILDIAQVDAPASASKNLLFEDESHPFVVAEYGIPRPPHARNLKRFGLQTEQIRQFERGFNAIRTDTYKLILGTDNSIELYDWKDDPEENNDLGTQHPEVVIALRKKLECWREEHEMAHYEDSDENWKLDTTVEERLRSLGYIG